MSSLEQRPQFELTDENGEVFVHAAWTSYTPEALTGRRWRSVAAPQRTALDACLIAVRHRRRTHPADSADFLQQEIEVAVRWLEAGEPCVCICDGVHRISRSNCYTGLTLDELIKLGNPLKLCWPEGRPELRPDTPEVC